MLPCLTLIRAGLQQIAVEDKGNTDTHLPSLGEDFWKAARIGSWALPKRAIHLGMVRGWVKHGGAGETKLSWSFYPTSGGEWLIAFRDSARLK